MTKDGNHTLMATFLDTDPYHFLLLPGSRQAKYVYSTPYNPLFSFHPQNAIMTVPLLILLSLFTCPPLSIASILVSYYFRWPVIGIEDPQVLTPAMESIWDIAWQAAFIPYDVITTTDMTAIAVPGLPVSEITSEIGIGLNPTSGRSQHQLHIHIVSHSLPFVRWEP